MATRLSFQEFKHLLDHRQLTEELLSEYICFDDQQAIPRLVFRTDALTDSPADDYDVDREIYLLDRERSL
jgi:hypothetical protein